MKKILLSLAMLCAVALGAWADDVNYIYYTVNADGKTITKHTDGSQADPTVLTSTLLENSNEDNLNTGWYVLNSTFSYGERIVISGDVKLILKDGYTLTAEQGIRINTDATLTIYAQSETEGTMGKLVAIENHHDKAAIGGNKNWEAGRLFIHGGEIEADASDGKYAAGIGGGYGDGSGMKGITIYSGKVTAEGAKYGAGIGGGKNNNNPGTINIYGGDIKANGGAGGAGIGGGVNRGNWPVNIYGGTVNAKGDGKGPMVEGSGAAGIGAGDEGDQTGRISIYGGTVTAEGFWGAGIGGGYNGKGGEIYIYDGTVTAKAGTASAGIGGGHCRAGGYVYISGGTVTAENEHADAAIGGGDQSAGGKIEIIGGHVTAKTNKIYESGKSTCNIGNGHGNEDPTTIILGINICVKSQNVLVAASNRIEACKEPRKRYNPEIREEWWTVEVYECEHKNLTYSYVNESGHTIHCKNCEYKINEGHSIVAPSSTCEKCGYGSGADICTLSFHQTSTASTTGYMASGTLYVKGQTIALPACTYAPEGWKFVGWLKQDATPTSIEAADSETSLLQPGDEYTVTSNETFFAHYRYDFTETWTWDDDLTSASLTFKAGNGESISVTLAISDRTETAATDEADGSITATATYTYTHGSTTYTFSNTQTKVLSYNLSLGEDDNTGALAKYNGRSMNVTLTGRTLYKDGNWNTLCLPFDVEIAGSPLEEATVKELTDASFADGTLTLTFTNATFIEAGRAYLIKWDSGTDLEPSGLVFTGVTLVNDLNDDAISTDDSGTATVTFMGTYKQLSYDADDRTVLFLGANNTLYYPQSGATIGAQRAYFKLSGITAGDKGTGVRSFVLDFGGDDGETTGIMNVQCSMFNVQSDNWYSLDGRKLAGKPAQKGLYINNGKKIVIK